MATLILKWPVNEGTGSTLNESINGREMYFATAGSYPAWTTGPSGVAGTAITISGATDSNAYASTDDSYSCNYAQSGDGINFTGITIAARFKRNSAEGGTIINSFYLDAADRPSSGNPADPLLAYGNAAFTTLFVTSGGAIGFGWAAGRGLSAYYPSKRAGAVSTGEWNIAIARLESPASVSIYANGTWYTGNPEYRSGCLTWGSGLTPTIFPSGGGFYTQYWAVGEGYSSPYCGGLDRSWSGDIGECRVYCGQLTDEEIEDLYQELLSGPVKNALMFSCNT